MSDNVDINVRSGYDSLISEIARYVHEYEVDSSLALTTAKNCLIDTIGCGLLALTFPACTKMLGPVYLEPLDQAFLYRQEKLMPAIHTQWYLSSSFLQL